MTIKQTGGIFGRSPTFTNVNVDGTVTADTYDLDAIAASKAVTAVDVFVYDTSKDSDGGAWRKRTQHTSWYNETLNTATRGARKEFPAVAVIVAESNKVTIYDGDDPALPMWMVFNISNTIGSLVALNGQISLGMSTTGLIEINFLANTLRRYISSALQFTTWSNTFAGSDFINIDAAVGIVNNSVNDVAMTVLPNAPIDAATGLPVPTIAVATAGGVSVIKDDGSVVDSSGAGVSNEVAFGGQNLVYQMGSTSQPFRVISLAGLADGFGYDRIYQRRSDAALNGKYPGIGVSNSDTAFAADSDGFVLGDDAEGLDIIHFGTIVADMQNKDLAARVTSTYNTGWMNGDIKLATLSDTDATNVTGSELVTNGTFDTDTTGWTFSATATDSSAAGYLEGTTGGGSNTLAYTTITTAAGKTYTVQMDIVSATTTAAISAGTTAFGSTLGISNYSTAGNTVTFTFVATGTLTYISVRSNSIPHTVRIDNVSVKLADADRSVNNKGLIVNGTVTRSAVATGADLVAYSGFSGSNYLEQPYNSDLDFGTGDFCVMGWVKYGSGGWMFERINPAGTGGYIRGIAAGSVLSFRAFSSAASTLTGTRNVNDDSWHMFTYFRSAGQEKLFVDGILDATITQAADNISANNQNLRVGLNSTGLNPFNGSLALLRISATAPSAEQIARIYQDERPLFQENAACTIAGTSDAVTALAHDSTTNLLHVGSSYGRSVFQGLRRVSNTTTAVGTAISASNGLVVEE